MDSDELMASNKAFSLNGFWRKSIAPAASACARACPSPCAEIKTMAIWQLAASSWACSSRPLIPGSRKSSTRQAASEGVAKFKKSSAEANSFTLSPTDLMSLLSADLTDSSSSTIEITTFSGYESPFEDSEEFRSQSRRSGLLRNVLFIVEDIASASPRCANSLREENLQRV